MGFAGFASHNTSCDTDRFLTVKRVIVHSCHCQYLAIKIIVMKTKKLHAPMAKVLTKQWNTILKLIDVYPTGRITLKNCLEK